jgi:hypothetical protein
MKTGLLQIILILGLVLSFAPLAAQQTSVDGVVLNRDNGQPIAGVHVRFALGLSLSIATQAYGAVSDAAGHFSISEMAPGYYTVDLERTGFLQGIGEKLMQGTNIELRLGQHLTDWKLEMSPLVMIAGRVVNQYGDPVTGVEIQPSEKALSSNSNERHSGYFNIKATDEKGQFRLFTPPGKYYLVAIPPHSAPFGPEEIRTDGTSALSYNRTYYPDAPDAGSATMIDAKQGMDISGIEIRMRSNSARSILMVSGVITGIPVGAKADIVYQHGTNPDHFSSGGAYPAGTDGKFSIYLRPGYVHLLGRCISLESVFQSEPKEIHLESQDIADMQFPLTIQTNGTLTGNIQIVGDHTATGTERNLMISLNPLDYFIPIQMPTETGSSGGFRIQGILPGNYQLTIFNMPDNSYIKAILLDNTAVNDRTLDFSRGVSKQPLKITISRNGAQISGNVRDTDGKPVLNPWISVFLIPESNQIPQSSGGAIHGGKYAFQGVPPGKYKIYAADTNKRAAGARTNLPDGDPDLASAETLEVSEGEHITRDLKVVAGKEEPRALPKE